MDSYFKEQCPHCNAMNFYNIGDATDLTVDDPTGVKCYKCGKKWGFGFAQEEGIGIDDDRILNGMARGDGT